LEQLFKVHEERQEDVPHGGCWGLILLVITVVSHLQTSTHRQQLSEYDLDRQNKVKLAPTYQKLRREGQRQDIVAL
jgi:hypothetical protein